MIITTLCHLELSGLNNDTFNKCVLLTIIISSRYISLPSSIIKLMSAHQKLYYYYFFYLKKKKKKKKKTLATATVTDWGGLKAQDSFFSFLFWFLRETKHKILIQSVGIFTPSPTPFDPDLSLSMTMSQYKYIY